jgi:hypothetical protein
MNVIVVALSLGAAALAKGALGEAGKEAYQALKKALLRSVALNDVEKLEQKPDSENRRSVIAEELADAGLAEDPELAHLARELIVALKGANAAAGATGVSMEEIEAVNLRLQRIEATGTGVSVKKAKVVNIDVSDVTAGVPTPGKLPRR